MKNLRMKQLKLMHELMTMANDETLYETWTMFGVPDEPTEDDFEWFADNNEEFADVFKLFLRLISDKDYL